MIYEFVPEVGSRVADLELTVQPAWRIGSKRPNSTGACAGMHSRAPVATVDLTEQEVVVRLTALEKLGALHGDLRLPRTAVRRVDITSHPFPEMRGVRAPGTALPRFLALGTWRRAGKKDFVAIYRGRPAVIMQLNEGLTDYQRLIISVSPSAVQSLLTPR